MFLAAVLVAATGFYARRSSLTPATFGLLLVSIGLWSLGAAFELLAATIAGKLFWAKVQYLGIVTLPVLWLFFTLEYSGDRRRPLPYFLLPVITAALVWTNEAHGLVWSEVSLDRALGVPYLLVGHGPWFWFAHLPYSYLLMVAGLLVLVRHYLDLPPGSRSPARSLIFAGLLPFVVNGAYVLGPVRLPFDPTPLGFALAALVTAWALLRKGLFELIPIAYRTVFQSLPDSVLVVDARGRIVALNPTAEHTFGLDQNAVRGRLAAEVVTFWKQLAPTDEQHLELEIATAGEPQHFVIQQTELKVRGDRRAGRILIARNVSRLKQFERRADFDPLTGLPNRRRFWESGARALSLAVREGWTAAILYLDLDRFKPVNDRFGHQLGDLVLKEVAVRLAGCLRKGDLLARFGGDEFVLLLHHATPESAREVADRLVDELERPFPIETLTIEIGASVGVVFYPHHGLHLGDLVALADQAMYRAKASGGSVFVLDEAPEPRTGAVRENDQLEP